MISDDIFKKRILAALDKPKKSKLVSILNSGLFLWFLTLCVVAAGGAYLTSYQQCRKDAEEEIERNTRIQRELFQRELRIREIILTAPSVSEMRNQLKQASEALRSARAERAHANRVATMGQLTASIAHEVNQPITAAVTNAEATLRWLG